MKKINVLLLIMSISFLASCATVPMASLSEDTEAKEFAPPPGKASVYVTRTSLLGAAVVFQVVLDGKVMGGLAQNTYHRFVVEPGSHSVAIFTNESQDAANFTAEEGKNYFFSAEPQMGWGSARAKVKVLDEDKGKENVLGSKLAQGMNY